MFDTKFIAQQIACVEVGWKARKVRTYYITSHHTFLAETAGGNCASALGDGQTPAKPDARPQPVVLPRVQVMYVVLHNLQWCSSGGSYL